MATVVKQLWGAHPSFLNLKPSRRLSQIVAVLPSNGLGEKITLTSAFREGDYSSHYQIAAVNATSNPRKWSARGYHHNKGARSQQSVPLPSTNAYHWHVYKSPAEIEQIKRKLGL